MSLLVTGFRGENGNLAWKGGKTVTHVIRQFRYGGLADRTIQNCGDIRAFLGSRLVAERDDLLPIVSCKFRCFVLHAFARGNVRLQQGRRLRPRASSTCSRWPFAASRRSATSGDCTPHSRRRRRAWHCVGAIGSIFPGFASGLVLLYYWLCPARAKSLCCRASSRVIPFRHCKRTILQEQHISVCKMVIQVSFVLSGCALLPGSF